MEWLQVKIADWNECGHSSVVNLRNVDTGMSSAEMDSSPGCESNQSIDDIRK
jgi:hypothetical protein